MAQPQLQDSDVDHAVRHFVDAIKELSWVKMVALEGVLPFGRVWTIISAPSFDSSFRRPIYDAQVAALRATTDFGIEFRLVNVQEVDNDLIDILPRTYHTLYNQEIAA